MTTQTIDRVFTTYQDAWADIALDERIRLLKASVADDVVFTSPANEGRGFDALLAHIADFQKCFPGASFTCSEVLVQHGQLLATWTMRSGDGTDYLNARSYARFNDEGRLTHLAGFWGDLPAE